MVFVEENYLQTERMKIHEVLGGLHMNNTMQYKGYVGNVEFSEEDGIYYGKIVGIRSLVSYEGESLKALRNDCKR